ncbi:MAG: hypothetical protein NTW08_09650 [Gammaproteobacteria bacterium]|nr:hypothetical protein [Gammaproteobacteria bacterium]
MPPSPYPSPYESDIDFDESSIIVYLIDITDMPDEQTIFSELLDFKMDYHQPHFRVVDNDLERLQGTSEYARLKTFSEKLVGAFEFTPTHSSDSPILIAIQFIVPISATPNPDITYQEAKKNLLQAAQASAPGVHRNTIEAIAAFESDVRRRRPPELCIRQLQSRSQRFMRQENALLKQALVTFIAVAVVALLIGIIGFVIGGALGCWLGPAAFISAIMAGQAAAVAVVSTAGALGLLGGGYLSHRFLDATEKPPIVLPPRSC